MERSVAVKRLSKILGKGFGYRIDDRAPTPEERQAAKDRHPDLEMAKNALAKALDARRQELQQSDAEYQRLLTELKAARKALQDNSVWYRHKITVGYSNRLWFSVKAEGDSWEEIFAKLKNGK